MRLTATNKGEGMNGKSPSVKSKWYTEPIRRISSAVAWLAVAVTVVLAILNQTDVLELVPAHYRSGVTAVIAGLGGFLALLHKVQGYLARNGVPGTNFNGMASPQTVHNAMVLSAQPIPPAFVPDEQEVRMAGVGEALGMNPDGTPKV